jgi:hypothetical protein
MIVGVKYARTGSPFVTPTHRHHGLPVFFIFRNSRQRHNASIASTLRDMFFPFLSALCSHLLYRPDHYGVDAMTLKDFNHFLGRFYDR